MWSKVDKNIFDVKFDANGYNPLHLYAHTSLEIKIKAEKIESYKTVKLDTMAKNMEMKKANIFNQNKEF